MDDLKVRRRLNHLKISITEELVLLQQFRIALISAIKDTLGDKLSTEAKQAFQNAYAIAEARRKA